MHGTGNDFFKQEAYKDYRWKLRLDINEADTTYARSRNRMECIFISSVFAAEEKILIVYFNLNV